jgi:hypothetical protein
MHQLRIKAMIQRITFRETRACIQSIPEVPYELFVRKFSPKVGREDIFKPAVANESLDEISNDNWVRVVNFTTSEDLIVK